VRIENGRFLAQEIPGAELIVYENVGHIPEFECADQFNRDLLGFLQ
jgi:pimeloyl-ACP methyl ester carboxylesterase